MRGLSQRFLDAMRRKLKQGRRRGYIGWDCHWKKAVFPYSPTQFLIDRFHGEIDELIIAIHEGKPEAILNEAADVANFAMFIADITAAHDLHEKMEQKTGENDG